MESHRRRMGVFTADRCAGARVGRNAAHQEGRALRMQCGAQVCRYVIDQQALGGFQVRKKGVAHFHCIDMARIGRVYRFEKNVISHELSMMVRDRIENVINLG